MVEDYTHLIKQIQSTMYLIMQLLATFFINNKNQIFSIIYSSNTFQDI